MRRRPYSIEICRSHPRRHFIVKGPQGQGTIAPNRKAAAEIISRWEAKRLGDSEWTFDDAKEPGAILVKRVGSEQSPARFRSWEQVALFMRAINEAAARRKIHPWTSVQDMLARPDRTMPPTVA